MDESWSDAKKWRMDLLKNAIAFSTAALLTLYVVDTVQAERAQSKARAEAYYSSKLKALSEYREYSYKAMFLAETVWNDVRHWNGRIPTPTMTEYLTAQSRLDVQMMILWDLFPRQHEDVRIALHCLNERHDKYRAYVATQLEGQEHLSRENTDRWYGSYVNLDRRVVDHLKRLTAKLHDELFAEESGRPAPIPSPARTKTQAPDPGAMWTCPSVEPKN